MNEKNSQTMIDIAMIVTILLIVLGVFGFVRWYSFLLPLPIAFCISVISNIIRGIYARHRNR